MLMCNYRSSYAAYEANKKYHIPMNGTFQSSVLGKPVEQCEEELREDENDVSTYYISNYTDSAKLRFSTTQHFHLSENKSLHNSQRVRECYFLNDSCDNIDYNCNAKHLRAL